MNSQIGRVKRVFKWGVAEEMIPVSVHEALLTVVGLSAGRSDARESEPLKPVPPAYIEAAKAKLSPVVRAMIDLQLVTGMRPGEVCQMRGCDIDTPGGCGCTAPRSTRRRIMGATARCISARVHRRSSGRS
ncbi:MAG TPA: hypothetical protein VM165_21095 [Planctomycetaceae bacterium]|nr:hypothetical protein [Planctomycetaceae bacterium]